MGFFGALTGNAGVIKPDKLSQEYGALLVPGETLEIGFVVVRDTFIFTNKRLLLVDKQGLTGRKVEYLSIPYGKITKYSIETAGNFDLDAELKIWIGSEELPLQKKFNKKVNIYDLHRILSTHVLS